MPFPSVSAFGEQVVYFIHAVHDFICMFKNLNMSYMQNDTCYVYITTLEYPPPPPPHPRPLRKLTGTFEVPCGPLSPRGSPGDRSLEFQCVILWSSLQCYHLSMRAYTTCCLLLLVLKNSCKWNALYSPSLMLSFHSVLCFWYAALLWCVVLPLRQSLLSLHLSRDPAA